MFPNLHVKIYEHAAWNMPEYMFSLFVFSRTKTELKILSLHGKISARKNPYSVFFLFFFNLFLEDWSQVNLLKPESLPRACPFFLRFYRIWLSCLAFLFLSSIALKLTSFLDFISILSAVAWNYPTCQAFFFYFWRVEVKLTCCSLKVFHEPSLFCVFTLAGSLAWLFCFYLL